MSAISRVRPYASAPPVLGRERCGRVTPVVHLFEAEEVFAARYHWRQAYPAVCGELVAPPPPDTQDDEEDCPGCHDCLHYCAACTTTATRFAQRPVTVEDPTGETGAGQPGCGQWKWNDKR